MVNRTKQPEGQESRVWSNKVKTEFRKLVYTVYAAATPESYQAALHTFRTWAERRAKLGYVKKWHCGF